MPAALARYPDKPITILVGYDIDSVGDLIARGLAEAAKEHLPQPIVVVNRPFFRLCPESSNKSTISCLLVNA